MIKPLQAIDHKVMHIFGVELKKKGFDELIHAAKIKN